MARSRLYRSQILLVNTRWKALDKIYKIYMRLHRSDLNMSAKTRHVFGVFSVTNTKKFDKKLRLQSCAKECIM